MIKSFQINGPQLVNSQSGFHHFIFVLGIQNWVTGKARLREKQSSVKGYAEGRAISQNCKYQGDRYGCKA